MANNLKLVSSTNVQLFQSSDLNSLTNGSYKFGSGSGVASNVYDNTGNLWPEADILISLGSITPAGSPYVLIAVLWSVDGSNFGDPQSAGAPNAGTDLYTVGADTGASAKLLPIPRIVMRPYKCKFMFGNQTGVTLASSGNSITLTPAGYNLNG